MNDSTRCGAKPNARHTLLYRIRRILLRAAENQTESSCGRLVDGLDTGDPTGHVIAAYIAAQELRHANPTAASQRLQCFYWACAAHGVPKLERVARTIDAWSDQLLAYFTTGRSGNRPTEAVNLLIKTIKRVGFVFGDFANYRLRLLLHCGITWHTPTATRLRGRSPRMAS